MVAGQPGDHAGEQAAPADGHDHHVGCPPELGESLGHHGSLPRHRARVVEGVHERRAGVGRMAQGSRGRVVVGVSHDAYDDPVAAQHRDPLALLARGGRRDEDGAVDAEARTGDREALGVVAGAGAHHSARACVLVELEDEVVGAAHLVGPDLLQVLALEQHLAAEGRRESLVAVEGRRLHHSHETSRGSSTSAAVTTGSAAGRSGTRQR